MSDETEHDWFEIDEETRVAKFCDKCGICACHSGDLADQPCPGEPTGPEDSPATEPATPDLPTDRSK